MAKAIDTLHRDGIEFCVKGSPAMFQNFAKHDVDPILDLMVASKISGNFMLKVNKTTRGNSAKKGIHIGDPTEYGIRLSMQLGDNGSCRSCMLIKAGEKHSPSDRHLYERLHRKLLKALTARKEKTLESTTKNAFQAPTVVTVSSGEDNVVPVLRAEEIPFLTPASSATVARVSTITLVPPEPLDLSARVREQHTALMHAERELARVKAERQELTRQERVLGDIVESLGTLIRLTERARSRQ